MKFFERKKKEKSYKTDYSSCCTNSFIVTAGWALIKKLDGVNSTCTCRKVKEQRVIRVIMRVIVAANDEELWHSAVELENRSKFVPNSESPDFVYSPSNAHLRVTY